MPSSRWTTRPLAEDPSVGVLSAERIRKLAAKGQLFDPETFDDASIRGASYQLRISCTGFVRVAPDGREEVVSYNPDGVRDDHFILHPGDVAQVSTMESLRIPFNIACRIGPRMAFVRRGLLVQTGLLVDPGYGYRWNAEDGSWVGAGISRLHFQLVNVSSDPIVIRNTERIASVEFSFIEGDTGDQETPSSATIQHQDADYVRMGFFQDVEAQQQQLQRLELERDAHRESDKFVRNVLTGVIAATVLAGIVTFYLAALLDAGLRDQLTVVAADYRLHFPSLVLALGLLISLIIVISYARELAEAVQTSKNLRDTIERETERSVERLRQETLRTVRECVNGQLTEGPVGDGNSQPAVESGR